jgi:riboflavin kinase/FMN adenylyltransferase
MLPADGVYACVAEVLSEKEPTSPVRFNAAVSIGVKPTFGKKVLTVEAHLIDADALGVDDLYGRRVRLHFHRWLRDQYRFPSLPDLVTQLRRDVASAS